MDPAPAASAPEKLPAAETAKAPAASEKSARRLLIEKNRQAALTKRNRQAALMRRSASQQRPQKRPCPARAVAPPPPPPPAPSAPCGGHSTTGMAELDELLGGGYPRGRITPVLQCAGAPPRSISPENLADRHDLGIARARALGTVRGSATLEHTLDPAQCRLAAGVPELQEL